MRTLENKEMNYDFTAQGGKVIQVRETYFSTINEALGSPPKGGWGNTLTSKLRERLELQKRLKEKQAGETLVIDEKDYELIKSVFNPEVYAFYVTNWEILEFYEYLDKLPKEEIKA